MAASSDPGNSSERKSGNRKTPPVFAGGEENYPYWKQEMGFWKEYTELKPEEIGFAILFRIEDRTAKEAIMNLKVEKIKCAEGYDNIIKCLDDLYEKDKSRSMFEAYTYFENYRRPKGVGVNEFLNEFEIRYQKTKAFDIEMSENLLAYRVLMCANIPVEKQQLVRLTLNKWDYKEMKKQLKSLFSDYSMDGNEGNTNVEDICEFTTSDVQDTFFTHNNRGNSNYSRGRARSNYRYQNSRPQRNRGNNSFRSRGNNPVGRDGRISTCSICGSRNHWADACPDRNQAFEINEVHLFDSDYEEASKLKHLVSDTLDSAVLDSAATKTAAGKLWVDDYISKLSQEERNNINQRSSHSVYKFGDGEKVTASYAVTIPAQIGERKVKINLDVLDKDIPCLLSKGSMKEINTKLDFMNDEVTMLNQKIPLFTSRSGHYCIPLTAKKRAIIEHSSENIPASNITLMVSNDLSPKEIAQKLHVQFSHPSPYRLTSLVKSANPKNTRAIVKEIKTVSDSCHICKEYRKAPRRPVVGLPLAHSFNEVLQLDLKFINSKVILHMIDSATRLSSCTILSSKSADQVMNGIMRYWISLYGAPQKYHTDNGGEFCNELIQEMAEKFNITIHTTPAESPWANGITERHNAIIEEMVIKTMADTNCSLPIALMWAVNAKNSLSSVNGYSPYTLVYGRNPSLPNFLENKLPAMSESTENDILRQHLEAKAKARESFIKAESSAKLQRAMSHNIRSTNNNKYFTGDVVLYKRNNSKKWHGPGTVLGKDGQTVLVKHGHNYVRVHPCRLLLDNPSSRKVEYKKPKENSFSNVNPLIPVTFHDDSSSSDSMTSESDTDSTTDSDEPIEDQEHPTNQNSDFATASTPSNQEQQEETENNKVKHKELNKEDEIDNVETTETQLGNLNDLDTLNVFSDNEDSDTTLPPDFDLNKLKKNMTIKCKLSHNDEWVKVKLASRAGRATGKYKYEWNTTLENGENMVINFAEHVSDIQEISDIPNDEHFMATKRDEIINTLTSTQDEKLSAKLKELQSWKEHGVFEEKEDDGSKCITTKWVLKDKIINNKPSTKARLCIRGFEEDAILRRDSPTAMKESVRFALGIAASKGWRLRSLDVKTAFLQSKNLERKVLIRPPKEAQTDKLWLLLKPVYGLGDASRLWYLTVREKLKNLNSQISKFDQGLFHFHSEDSELTAVLIVFVDDILTLGREEIITKICENLKDIFNIGSESSDMFRYIGMHMAQEPTYVINLEQLTYINSISPILITRSDNISKESEISSQETKALRSLVGKLNWAFQVSRPDIGFQTRYLSTVMHQAKVKDLYFANKTLKYLQCEPKTIKFPSLKDIEEAFLLVFADASYGNLPSGHSQAAFIILLCDKDYNSFPIGWNSYKLHRVCCNTLAAETLALNEALDNCVLLSTIYSEVIHYDSKKKIPIKALTDSKSLVAASSTTNLIKEKRLRIEVAALRESIENEELILKWIDSKYQLANCLTKAGASSKTLCEVIETGRCSKEIIAALNV